MNLIHCDKADVRAMSEQEAPELEPFDELEVADVGTVRDGVLELFGAWDTRRAPLVRLGERDPIPDLVREAVYARDGHRCVRCGSGHRLQLDHIEPWSAGGSDRSWNLRTYCAVCNTARSNYVSALDRPVTPVAAGCESCTAYVDEPVRVFCMRCCRPGFADRGWIV